MTKGEKDELKAKEKEMKDLRKKFKRSSLNLLHVSQSLCI